MLAGANQNLRLGLGHFTGRDPGEAVQTYHGVRKTNPKTRSFYLAGIRNFVFASDSGGSNKAVGRDSLVALDRYVADPRIDLILLANRRDEV